MRFQRRLLSMLACSVLVRAGFAEAAPQTFVVDSAQSSLAIVNVVFNKIPPTYQSSLVPVEPDDWVRSLAGSFVADVTPEDSVTLESANIQILGPPMLGDQNRLATARTGRDAGDITLDALSFSVNQAGNVTFITGTIDFDLSLGNVRISSPEPFSLHGVTSATTNQGVPMVDGSHVTIPILLSFEDVTVFTNASASFDIVGSIQSVPEPSKALTSVVALVVLAVIRRKTS